MADCGAFNCSVTKKNFPDRTFHYFPKDPISSARWVQLVRRQDLLDKSPAYLCEHITLCSEHFEPSQYIPGSKRLKKDAEPTLFDFTPSKTVLSERNLSWPQTSAKKPTFRGRHYKQLRIDSDVSDDPDEIVTKIKEEPGIVSDYGLGEGESDVCLPRRRSEQCQTDPELEPPPRLSPPAGVLWTYIKDVRREHQKLLQMLSSLRKLEDLVNFRTLNPDWKQQELSGRQLDLKAAPPLPLLTVRNGVSHASQLSRDALSVNPLNELLLKPLTPLDAWKAVSQANIKLLLMEQRLLMAQKEKLLDLLHHMEALHHKENVLKKLRSLINQRVEVIHTASHGRLHTQVKPTRKRQRWSEKDVRRGLEVRKYVSHHVYRRLREKACLPIPTAKYLQHAAPRYPKLASLFREVTKTSLRRMPYNRKYHSRTTPMPPYAIRADAAKRRGFTANGCSKASQLSQAAESPNSAEDSRTIQDQHGGSNDDYQGSESSESDQSRTDLNLITLARARLSEEENDSSCGCTDGVPAEVSAMDTTGPPARKPASHTKKVSPTKHTARKTYIVKRRQGGVSATSEKSPAEKTVSRCTEKVGLDCEETPGVTRTGVLGGKKVVVMTREEVARLVTSRAVSSSRTVLVQTPFQSQSNPSGSPKKEKKSNKKVNSHMT